LPGRLRIPPLRSRQTLKTSGDRGSFLLLEIRKNLKKLLALTVLAYAFIDDRDRIDCLDDEIRGYIVER
jgi:hypothetical protein